MLLSWQIGQKRGKSEKWSGEGAKRSQSVLHRCNHPSVYGALSGPVLRDAARLSQRYPPIARDGVFGVLTWPIGCGGAIPPPPPQKWYLSDTCAISDENKGMGAIPPRCDTISNRYCAIWVGISHWAAKTVHFWGYTNANEIAYVVPKFAPFPDHFSDFPCFWPVSHESSISRVARHPFDTQKLCRNRSRGNLNRA